MIITERQLRKIIREVIKESSINEIHPALAGAVAKSVMDRQAKEKARQNQSSGSSSSSSYTKRKYPSHDSSSSRKAWESPPKTNFDRVDSSLLDYELVMKQCRKYFMHCVEEFPDAIKPEKWADSNIPDFKSKQLRKEFKESCIDLLYQVKDKAGRYLRTTPQDKRKGFHNPKARASTVRYGIDSQEFYDEYYDLDIPGRY